MSALPWPVESITEDDAREFFQKGADKQFSGSWRFDNKYSPRLHDINKDGKHWAYRFKAFKRATWRSSTDTPYRKGPYFTFATSHPSKQEAEAWCYRDIYAKVHKNASKFKTPKRKSTTADRDLRAAKRTARKDPAAAKQREHDQQTQKVRAEMLQSVARRVTFRPSTLAVTASDNVAPSNATPVAPTRASRRGLGAKTRRHNKRVQQKLAKAEQAIQDATDNVAQIRAAYNSIEAGADSTFSAPIQTRGAAVGSTAIHTAVAVVAEATPTSLASDTVAAPIVQDANDEAQTSEDESVHDDNPLPLETAMAMATLSNAQARQLVYQMKCVCYCNMWLVKQWRAYADAVKSLQVGQRSPHIPTVTSSLHALIKHWKEEPPEDLTLWNILERRAGRTKTIYHVDTMRKWVKHWNITKSFRIASFNSTGDRSWYVGAHFATMVFKQKMRELMHNRTLSKIAMARFANDPGDNGFRSLLERRHKDCGTSLHRKVPPQIEIADSTALRWMKLCDAMHGRHVKGYADRRNDADIVQELKDYCVTMELLEKRMPLWTKSREGNIVIADRLRCDDDGIEDGSRFDFKTYYELKDIEPPQICLHGHEEGLCKCHKPVMHWGHDEAVFWSNNLSTLEWTVDGERALRPKNPGRGVMVSAFVCEQRGFGIHVTNEEWLRLLPIYNKFHQQHPWLKVNEPVAPEYDRQIGLVLFDYGSNKPKEDLGGDPALTTGWWNCAKFRVQCDFVLQCFNKLHGDTHQLMLQIDQSSLVSSACVVGSCRRFGA